MRNQPNLTIFLPITLLNFQARVKSKAALLEWRTARESNNQSWEIEHSTDARDRQTIGFIKGSGNSSQGTSYDITY